MSVTSTAVDEYTPPQVVDRLRDRVREFQGRVPDQLIVDTHTEAQRATNLLKMIADIRKDAEKDRKRETEPLVKRKRQIDGSFKEVIDPLTQTEQVIKAGLLGYQQEQRRIQQEAERKALEAARQAEADAAAAALLSDDPAPVPAAPQPVVPAMRPTTVTTAVAQTSLRRTWKVEITDLRALCKAIADGDAPEGYVTGNATALRAALMALPEDQRKALAVPGVRFFQDEGIAVR